MQSAQGYHSPKFSSVPVNRFTLTTIEPKISRQVIWVWFNWNNVFISRVKSSSLRSTHITRPSSDPIFSCSINHLDIRVPTRTVQRGSGGTEGTAGYIKATFLRRGSRGDAAPVSLAPRPAPVSSRKEEGKKKKHPPRVWHERLARTW